MRLAAAFDAADTDGNGGISFAEASAVVRSLTQAVFSALDTNCDGELDRSELGLPDEGGCG